MLEHPEQTLNSCCSSCCCRTSSRPRCSACVLDDELGAARRRSSGIVVEIVLFFVIGEVTPKTYAVQHTDRAALDGRAGCLWFLTNFPPLRLLVARPDRHRQRRCCPGKGLKEGPFVTEEDIRTMADVAAEEDVIEGEERQLIHSIFEFGDTVVREVMLPRPDMVVVDADATIEAAIETADRGRLLAPARVRGHAPTTSSASCTSRTSSAERARAKATTGALRAPRGGVRARAEARRRAAARDAEQAVPHGDRHRRVRRHRRARDARGPARGDRGRDHRRVRRRDARASSTSPTARCASPAARRSTT